ncbi:hypothetical protein CAPTEDRAFT_164698 [Capitella teleta]|uniref:Lipocalin/cytosolic fatty-acid binding domain-containing protein n=1 Tax=Capitella teleta TaxID=283909 RepID=R7TGQ9_CAPTE|nr:hypothetical protein CAPTEDRAFT_164698 [Capitella teleta]|eukprot:ELT92677.1 hypothetical protein CAPTEDRAFT_164698 [Capitella teleta]
MSTPNFAGKYSFVKNENFDAFLEANGAPWIARKMACATSPELEVTQEGDKMTFKLVSMMQTREISFTIGEEYEEKQHDDTVTKVKPEMKDGKIVLHYSPSEECKDRVKPQTHTREIDGDTLTLTLEIGDLVAKRIFQRVKE